MYSLVYLDIWKQYSIPLILLLLFLSSNRQVGAIPAFSRMSWSRQHFVLAKTLKWESWILEDWWLVSRNIRSATVERARNLKKQLSIGWKWYWTRLIKDCSVFSNSWIYRIWDIKDICGTLLSSRTSFHIHLYPIRQRATFLRIAWFVFYEFRPRTWSMSAF